MNRPAVVIVGLALTACTPAQQTQNQRVVRPVEGLVVRVDAAEVEVEAQACLEAGWLEQIACSPGTREHESLVVIRARPSDVHAALLLAGFEPGSPGRWSFEDDVLSHTEPTGDRLRVFARYEVDGRQHEEPIGTWITDGNGGAFPDDPWIFGGSIMAPNPEWMGPGEHYVADQTGSIIGLATFGDEVVGFSNVLADQEAVQAPEWKVRSSHVPPVGTPVTIILRAAGEE